MASQNQEQQKNVKHPFSVPALIMEIRIFFSLQSLKNHFTSQVILFYDSMLGNLV